LKITQSSSSRHPPENLKIIKSKEAITDKRSETGERGEGVGQFSGALNFYSYNSKSFGKNSLNIQIGHG